MQDYRSIPLSCIRDDPDDRDFRKFSAAPPIDLPETCDVPAQPRIRDQGRSNACTGFAAAFCFQQILRSRGMLEDVELSSKFAWYWARAADGNEAEDTGAQIRNAMAGLAVHGCCPEDEWPESSPFSQEPNASSKAWGTALSMPTYERLANVREIKYAVAVEQQSVVIGLPIYTAFYDSPLRNNGIVPAQSKLGQLEGWHAMVVTGYTKERLIIANSWGPNWGAKGYVFVPFWYLDVAATGDIPGHDSWTAGMQDIQDAPSPNFG